MVLIPNNCDPKKSIGMSKAIDYAHIHSQLTMSHWLRVLQQREQKERKAIRNTTEAARKAYEGLPIKGAKKNLQR